MAFTSHRRNGTLPIALTLLTLCGPAIGFGQAQPAPKRRSMEKDVQQKTTLENSTGKIFLALHVGEFQLLYAPLLLGVELGLSLSPRFALTGQLEGSVPFPLSSQLGQNQAPNELSDEGDAIAAAGVRWFPMQGSFHIDAHLHFDRVTGWSIGTSDDGAGSYSNDLRTRLGPVVSIGNRWKMGASGFSLGLAYFSLGYAIFMSSENRTVEGLEGTVDSRNELKENQRSENSLRRTIIRGARAVVQYAF